MREPLVYTPSTSNPPTYSALLSSHKSPRAECTPEHVGEFLKAIGLDHHVATFIKEDVSGDLLLGDIEEILEELGVTSAAEKFKIKVHGRG